MVITNVPCDSTYVSIISVISKYYIIFKITPVTLNVIAGKMFQSPDITLIVEFIFMFYKEKPIDWLLDHILWVKVCNPEKDAVSLFY